MIQPIHTVMVPMHLRRDDGDMPLVMAEVSTHPKGDRHIRLLDGVLGTELPWSAYSHFPGGDVYDYVQETVTAALQATEAALHPPQQRTETSTASAIGWRTSTTTHQ